MPGSQPSGSFPTPWLHLPSSLPLPLLASQPLVVVPVIVTSACDQAFPWKVPRVRVMAAPARMFPRKFESVMVTASATHHVTLHASPPPAMTTEKSVPVSAPVPRVPILKIQVPSAGPSSVNVPVNSAAASKQ